MKAPAILPDQYYVDRQKYIEEFQTLVAAGQKHISLGDTHAIYGSGKTTVLAKIYQELKSQPNWTPIWIPLDEFSIYHSNASIQDIDSFEALVQNFQDYWRLLIGLGNELDKEAFGDFRNVMENINNEALAHLLNREQRDVKVEVKSGDVDISTWSKVSGEGVTIKTGDISNTVIVSEKEVLTLELETARSKFTQEFLERFNRIAANKNYILFADDFCWIIDQKIGDWFLQLVRDMDHTVVIVSRTITEMDLSWNRERMTELRLEPFSRDQVGELLVKRLGNPLVSEALVASVHEFSFGHPLMISLAVDLLERAQPKNPQEACQIISNLARSNGLAQKTNPAQGTGSEIVLRSYEELGQRVDALIQAFRQDVAIKDPELLIAFDICTVARRFDYELMAYTLNRLEMEKDPEADPSKVKRSTSSRAAYLMKRLPSYSFLQTRTMETGKDYYRIHNFVHERMNALVQQSDTSHYEHLHEILASYYLSEGMEYDLSLAGKSEYARMYRLEDPDWQTSMVEWLYHLCQLQERKTARLQFAKLYMEAFDWWGWYLPFKFNEDLLTVWEQTQPEQDCEFLEMFRNFQKAYPTGYKKFGKGDWDQVIIELENLIIDLELYKPAEKMTPDERMTRGQIERYLAEAYRFNTVPDLKAAEEHYMEGRDYFLSNWNKDWMTGYLADLYFEGGNYSLAVETARKSNTSILNESEDYRELDHELASQNYRVIGDAFLAKGEIPEAVGAYARTIAHAYIFNFIPEFPDEYSYTWYADMTQHVADKLMSLWQMGLPEKAVSACEYLQNFWWQNTRYSKTIFTAIESEPVEILAADDTSQIISYCMPAIPGSESFNKRNKIGSAASLHMCKALLNPKDFNP